MNNPLNPEEFRRQGHLLVDFIADYYTNIQQFPVLSQVQPGYLRQLLPQSAPETSEPIEKIIADIQTHIIPGITHWQHPSHFAYFPCTASTAGVLGELLTAGDGGGVIMGTTCEALLATLVAARDQKLSQVGKDKLSKLVVYCSDQTHCAFQKAARIVGIQSGNIRVITTTKTTSFGMSSDSLESAIRLDLRNGLVPLFLCATVGTTATAAVDPLEAICHVANKHSLWVHVDAAYAGSACICPEFRHFIDGVEGVDSFSLNAHKWLLTTLDCCCLWLKDPNALKKSLSTNPEYLKNNASESGGVVDYKDWQVTLSRRFRSLKLWLVLRSYGVDGLRSFIRSHVSMAETFMQLVSEDERFELVVPCHFSLVCFRILLPAERRRLRRTNEMNKKLLEAVNGSGRVFMTHVVAGGIYMIRFAVGATLTERRHVAAAWDVVVEHADAMEKGVLE
ncbi:Tyrosine decarboxylase [Linum grandiflorum]